MNRLLIEIYIMEFKIKIKEKLDHNWTEWFENVRIDYEEESTIISGECRDHSELHGILNKIRDLNLKLISVESK